MLNFLFSHFNTIFLTIWVLFYIVVMLRVFYPHFVKSVSYKYLIAGAVSIHLLYGAVATWLTYIAWSVPGNTQGNILVLAPLPPEAPLPMGIMEWMRPLFEGTHGYFAGYSFFHYFLGTFALFFVTALFVSFFRLYDVGYPGRFEKGDMYIIALAFLMTGYAGSIVLVPMSLVIAVGIVLVKLVAKKNNHVNIPNSFILAAPFAFIFAIPLLSIVHLWPLLKI